MISFLPTLKFIFRQDQTIPEQNQVKGIEKLTTEEQKIQECIATGGSMKWSQIILPEGKRFNYGMLIMKHSHKTSDFCVVFLTYPP